MSSDRKAWGKSRGLHPFPLSLPGAQPEGRSCSSIKNYRILGVTAKATDEEIKKAFRALARKYHPDVAKDKKSAEDKFKEINEANEVLSDPESRRKYDQLGADWKTGAASRAAPRQGGGRSYGPWMPPCRSRFPPVLSKDRSCASAARVCRPEPESAGMCTSPLPSTSRLTSARRRNSCGSNWPRYPTLTLGNPPDGRARATSLCRRWKARSLEPRHPAGTVQKSPGHDVQIEKPAGSMGTA